LPAVPVVVVELVRVTVVVVLVVVVVVVRQIPSSLNKDRYVQALLMRTAPDMSACVTALIRTSPEVSAATCKVLVKSEP